MALELIATIDSEVEEILSFRCCSIHGLNLELLIKNKGSDPIRIRNYFVLRSGSESLKIEHLYPPHPRVAAPQEHIAFYTSMDKSVWEQYDRISIYDTEGREYGFSIKG